MGAKFRIPVQKLSYKGVPGDQVAKSMVEAAAFAWQCPYRAATHNKGVMNGIDAACVAAGQDYRAIEAGAHAFAARDGQYRGLTRYTIQDGCLEGSIQMPMAVGTVGGALATHPTYRYVHEILGSPDAATLAAVLVCVGLAQNFAAMRALVTEGISKGHMRLQARSVCSAASIPHAQMDAVVTAMIQVGRITVDEAARQLVLLSAPSKTVQQAVELASSPSVCAASGAHASRGSTSSQMEMAPAAINYISALARGMPLKASL